jgi:hypothetical protein
MPSREQGFYSPSEERVAVVAEYSLVLCGDSHHRGGFLSHALHFSPSGN